MFLEPSALKTWKRDVFLVRDGSAWHLEHLFACIDQRTRTHLCKRKVQSKTNEREAAVLQGEAFFHIGNGSSD